MAAQARPGSMVAWWGGSVLALAMVSGEEKGRIRLVLARGKEARVTPGRVAFEIGRGDAPGVGAEERRLAGEQVAAMTRQLEERAGEVDVPLVWEILLEEAGEGASPPAVDPADLARLALDDGSSSARVAVIWALAADGVHFTRKGDAWEPRPRPAVEELQRERARVAELERERQELFEELSRAAAGDEYRARDTETERRYLDALEQYAIHEEASPPGPRDLALEALEASGERWDRPHAAAFRLLRRLGRLQDDDENLQIRRFNLRTDFDEPVLAQARRAVERGPSVADRTDLSELTTVSIDGPSTREIDDALSVEDRGDGSVRVGVHIADPAAFVEVGDLVDDEALARGVTHYFPDRRLTMLPAQISESAASLLAGERRPALSFMVDLDVSGEIAGFEVFRSWIRSDARLDYTEADRLIGETGAPFADLLAALDRVARLREAARIAAGAIVIEAPEVDLHVAADGVISIERSDRDSPSHRIVSEAMVLAGEVGAGFCRREGLPAIYRRQDAPSFRVELPAAGAWDAVLVRAVRRRLKRAEISLQPGRHASLGLDAYAQVTSPLRRYQDLACHRQIAAHLAGEEPPYDADAMQRVAATTERAESDARKAERNRADYWMLRYLGARGGETLEATVVDVQSRTVVQLDETLWEQPMPSVKGVAPGERIRVQVERVNPRAGLLVLRRES